METIIRIKKNKPAFKALIQLAKELEKNDHTSILISEVNKKKQNVEIIPPLGNSINLFDCFDQLTDFPTMDEIRTQEWPKIL